MSFESKSLKESIMPVLLQFMPFSGEMRSKQFAAWFGADAPADARYGRYPTLNEITTAFERVALDGLTLNTEASGKSWVVVITGAEGDVLRIDAKQRGADVHNVLFTVTGDRDTLEYLVAHLPASCGSFVISSDGQQPGIVTAGSA